MLNLFQHLILENQILKRVQDDRKCSTGSDIKRVFIHYDKQELKVDYDYKKISEMEMIQSVAPFGYTLRKPQIV